ncbi:3-deoxy-D-manno-octulosonic-acid transferase [Vibrio ishigakensis]|uniref:3-deoxy-D-manno-octulosonic acid transferase n=1 Tax=Vibrio ishigakensis TaxID=1481914 RepID=A0A0B8QJK5_9VIBR|nr:3-deoxy-D-manno-octulosonic-acid transferase [Vibrio ishigakensis]
MLFSPFLLTILLKKKTGKPSVGKRWKEYFGFTPKMDTNAPFWIHTVSVGETIAAIPLIKALKRKYLQNHLAHHHYYYRGRAS